MACLSKSSTLIFVRQAFVTFRWGAELIPTVSLLTNVSNSAGTQLTGPGYTVGDI